jgi:hypothetical protein
MAAQFGVNSRVKLRKLSTAGESDGWRRANIATFHLTVGCRNGRNVRPKPRASGSAIEGQITANGGTAAEFGKFIDDETREWGEVIRAAGLKGE